jgi:hypothetical protein
MSAIRTALLTLTLIAAPLLVQEDKVLAGGPDGYPAASMPDAKCRAQARLENGSQKMARYDLCMQQKKNGNQK